MFSFTLLTTNRNNCKRIPYCEKALSKCKCKELTPGMALILLTLKVFNLNVILYSACTPHNATRKANGTSLHQFPVSATTKTTRKVSYSCPVWKTIRILCHIQLCIKSSSIIGVAVCCSVKLAPIWDHTFSHGLTERWGNALEISKEWVRHLNTKGGFVQGWPTRH